MKDLAWCSKVRQRRLETGLSQSQLAIKARLSRNYVSMIERGIANYSFEAMERINIALGLHHNNHQALRNALHWAAAWKRAAKHQRARLRCVAKLGVGFLRRNHKTQVEMEAVQKRIEKWEGLARTYLRTRPLYIYRADGYIECPACHQFSHRKRDHPLHQDSCLDGKLEAALYPPEEQCD